MTRAARVRLLLVQTGRDVGTPERVVWELATRLPESRYTVLAWLMPAAELDEFAASLEERGVGVERLGGIHSRWDLRGHAAAWAALRRARPDIVHLHAVWPEVPRHLPGFARLVGVERLVVTAQGLVHRVPPELKPELRAADVVTVACRPSAEALVRDGLPRRVPRVVPNGADLPDQVAELPAARKLRDRFGAGLFRPLWVCATRLEEPKGHDVLLDALAEVRAHRLDFVAVLAGEGTRRVWLERRAAELGLEGAVHFLGQVESLGPLLLAADAFVLPSREEALPLSLLEAMARARPVIASQVGGVPEVVEDRIHGRLVPPGDVPALAGALEAFHQKPDAARQMGLHGAERMRSSFTWARVVAAYEAVYDDVLGLAGFTPEEARGRKARRR